MRRCRRGDDYFHSSAAESVLEKDAADGARVLAEATFALANAD
jgi:hypothetical protein